MNASELIEDELDVTTLVEDGATAATEFDNISVAVVVDDDDNDDDTEVDDVLLDCNDDDIYDEVVVVLLTFGIVGVDDDETGNCNDVALLELYELLLLLNELFDPLFASILLQGESTVGCNFFFALAGELVSFRLPSGDPFSRFSSS